jgi:hypothetical protein
LTSMTGGLLGASKSPTSVRNDLSLKLEEQKLLDSHRRCAGDPLPLLNKPLARSPSQTSSTVRRRHLKLPPLVESSVQTGRSSQEEIQIKPPVITLTKKPKSKSTSFGRSCKPE